MKVSATSSYRYSWTPAPSALAPLPAAQFSGVVDMRSARKQKTALKAAAPQ
jgi:hypothetical protein